MTYANISAMIFSKNRPLQLFALLESMVKNSDFDPGSCFVLYKADEKYFTPYMEVWSYFPDVNFVAEWNFKTQVEEFVFNAKPNICFFTDDDVFKNKVSIAKCLQTLNNDPGAVAFSLRLGKHLNFCYSTQRPQSLPDFKSCGHGVVSWNYKNKDWDWNYPLSVDGHIFRRDYFLEVLKQTNPNWHSPNTFEGLLSHLHPSLNKEIMYCLEDSVVFNIPHNKVQAEVNNVFGGGSEDDLLGLWENNKKIDISTFQGIKNISAHQLVDLQVKDR